MARDGKVRLHVDTPSLIELDPRMIRQDFADRRGLHSCRPKNSFRYDSGWRARTLNGHAVLINVGRHGAGSSLHTEFDERFLGRGGKLRWIGREQPLCAFDEKNIGLGGIDVAKVMLESVARD